VNIGTHGRASSEHSPAKQLRELAARFFKLESALLVVILGAMIVIFTIISPSGEFFSSGNIRSIALDTSEILVLSAGEMLIIVAAGLDLSIGSIVVFSSVVGAKTLVALSGSPAQVAQFTYPHLALGITAGVVVAVLAGLGWGTLNGLLTAKWGVPPFIVTLGTLSVAVGLAQVITGGLNVPNIPPALQNSYGSGQLFGIPWLVWTAIIVVGILWILLELTRYGLHTYAIGASPEAARRAGINVRLHTISLYALMGLLAGIVGIMDVARFDTASIFAHTQDNLTAITAAVIGGTSLFGGRGRMLGTVIGAFIPATLRNGFVLIGVEPFWQNVAIGSVLITAVYIDQMRRRRAKIT
jgi:Ribose/xylose/arabinose/galactoside ABC-type transport systems, permease components